MLARRRTAETASVILLIEGALPADELQELRCDLSRIEFVSGSGTAGWAARQVKRNAQAIADPCVEGWRERIGARLVGHPLFALAAQPKRIIGPMLTRYRPGDAYGAHVDEAFMDGSRTDLSFTLFLDDPEGYDGGDLVIETSAGEDAYKPAAGCLVLYPATTLHRVAPVTRGTRHAAVGWVRSHIRSAEQRELLFDLETARRRLFEAAGKTADFDLLSKCAANLARMWSED
jgi:PKHD-type hydroxylase